MIQYNRNATPPVVIVTDQNGVEVTWPLDVFEADPSACVPPIVPEVPAEIQMWQARAMLIRMNMLASVNQAVAASGNPEIQNAWEYAPNVVRKSNFVLAMAGALGLDDVTIDNLFIEGAKIK